MNTAQHTHAQPKASVRGLPRLRSSQCRSAAVAAASTRIPPRTLAVATWRGEGGTQAFYKQTAGGIRTHTLTVRRLRSAPISSSSRWPSALASRAQLSLCTAVFLRSRGHRAPTSTKVSGNTERRRIPAVYTAPKVW
ncbi:hypothetical protein MRX96_043807 [Rhipicephalus microplus]